jgi:hypothetical protein
VALDQSAAFDCVDHAVLLSRLHSMFGVSGLALNWFQSYLQSRTSYVKFGSHKSATTGYKIGVPQGSALGPALFSLYIAPLANVVRSFGVNHHQYADDTQLYLAAKCSNISSQLSLIEGCTTAVHNWLAHNGLCLNPDKSEALCVSSGRAKPTQPSAVVVSGAGITFSDSVKSLGVYLDDRLSFNKQVDSVCKSCFYHIRALRHVRPSLPMDVARTVACSIVSSRLDYCNALYYNMSASNLNKLQRVQNALARTVLCLRKYDHIRPALAELHWLPISQRVTYKIATTTFKVLNTSQPQYLRDLLVMYVPRRELRSSTQQLLQANRVRTAMGERAFRNSAVSVWNSLPSDVRICSSINSFKRQLKTYLFSVAYSV